MTSSSTPERPHLVKRIRTDLRRFAELEPTSRLDLVRAALELALARLELVGSKPETWVAASPQGSPRNAPEIVDRVAFAIPRAAARVPWRATCLVQALAAKHWLSRLGIASQLKLGARRGDNRSLDAHAWLEIDGRIVVGGESADYLPFGPRREA